MELEKPYTLVDKRDNNPYIVAKLKDNRIWMCENLRLVGDKEIVLTPEDSDVASDFILPASIDSWFRDYDVSNVHIDSIYGGYYNWFAATAGEGTQSKSSGDVSHSICPKGWRLPTIDEYDAMVDRYGSSSDYTSQSSALRATPVPGFVLSGFYRFSSPYNQGSDGYYYSSTAYSTSSAYRFFLGIWNSNLSRYGTKTVGFSVRGIVREPEPIPDKKKWSQ